MSIRLKLNLTLALTILYFSCLCSVAHAATFVTEDVQQDTTWDVANSPYVVQTDLYIYPNTKLAINPGVVVKFEPGIQMIVAGTLEALGSDAMPIEFTSNYDDEIGGSTDEDFCYEDFGAGLNSLGEVCEDVYTPAAGDWGGVSFVESGDSKIENAHIAYADYPITTMTSNVSLLNIDIKNSNSGLQVFNKSNVTFSDSVFDGVPENDLFVFNESSLKVIGLSVLGGNRDYPGYLAYVFNGSNLSLKDSSLADCPFFGCLIAFDQNNYKNKPSNFEILNSSLAGAGTGIHSHGSGAISANISGSKFADFAEYAVENYSTVFVINAENNYWGDLSGPHNPDSNPTGLGGKVTSGVKFEPWLTEWPPPPPPPEIPDEYYARITNAPNGIATMFDNPNKTANPIKTFPNDWVLKVLYTTLTTENWVKVVDMTDESEGWIEGGVSILPYEKSKQEVFENDSVDNLSGKDNFENRKQTLIQAATKYYNDENTKFSLYSSNDTTNISNLKQKGIPIELIFAIISGESGGGPSSGFSNEIVTFDYGHGIMQVTMDALAHEDPKSKYFGYKNNADDPRGFYSYVLNYLCQEKKSDQYKKCYENTESHNNKAKPYSHYDHLDTNPKYKQYANTIQSIYSNVKDGLGILTQKLQSAIRNSCEDGNYTVEGVTFSCDDLIKVKTVWFYNGVPKPVDSKANNYMQHISNQFKNLESLFGLVYDNKDKLIEKLAIANRHRIEIKAHSPVYVSIKDPNDNSVGSINGEVVENVPTGAYDPDSERAVIFFPEDTYTYKVVGDASGGTYGLDIENYDDSDEPISFNAVDLPISPGEIHTYKVDKNKLAINTPDAVSIQIDENGDGIPERTIHSGKLFSSITEPATVPATNTPPRFGSVVPVWLLENKIEPRVLGAAIANAEPVVQKLSKPSNNKKTKIQIKQNKVALNQNNQKIQENNSSRTPLESVKKLKWWQKLWNLLFN